MSKKQFLQDNLKPGEVYAGLVLGTDGKPDEHLFLLPGRAESMDWAKSSKWAADAGGRLPTRQEQSILFTNCKAHLPRRWHWSCETYEGNASCAWDCHFGHGFSFSRKSYDGSAVAVRTIQLIG